LLTRAKKKKKKDLGDQLKKPTIRGGGYAKFGGGKKQKQDFEKRYIKKQRRGENSAS